MELIFRDMDKMTLNELSLDRTIGIKFQFAKGRRVIYEVVDWAKDTREEYVTYFSRTKGLETTLTKVSFLIVIVKNEKGSYQVFNLDDCGDKEIVVIE